MFLRRLSTEFDKYAGYALSTHHIETCKYEVFTEPEHTFIHDVKSSNDLLYLDKNVVEEKFKVKLNSLEEIEI